MLKGNLPFVLQVEDIADILDIGGMTIINLLIVINLM